MSSPAGNRTPVSRVTGGDTYHYTTEELQTIELFFYLKICIMVHIFLRQFLRKDFSLISIFFILQISFKRDIT